MALQILKNNDFNLCWVVNGLSVLSSAVNLTPAHSREHGHVLSPGCHVDAADVEDDDMPLAECFAALQAKLELQFENAERLTAIIRDKLSGLLPNG